MQVTELENISGWKPLKFGVHQDYLTIEYQNTTGIDSGKSTD